MKQGAAQEIKSRLPILDLIEGYIPVERAGKNYKARCPFHTEKSPSFYISTERDTYYCFGCGKKGDIFSFLEEYEGLDFKQALKILADKAGVDLGAYSFNEKKGDETSELFRLLESATVFFQDRLKKDPTAVEYLEKRGVTQKTIETFRIGFAPKDWKELYTYLKDKKFTDTQIETAGLAKAGDYGLYDRFRNRIMFPFMDTSGRVIGFSGRTIDPDSKEAKYINSPETPVFNKGEVFYGLYQAKDAIRTQKSVIVVEGQMDVIMTHQAGIHRVVASSGTAFSGSDSGRDGKASHLGIIKRLTDTIVLAFDNDSAGIKAMYRATALALQSGFYTYCISITGGKDFADIARESVTELRALIEEKQDAVLFFIRYLKDHTTDRVMAKAITEKIWPLLALIGSPIEQSHYITNIGALLRIDERTLLDDFRLFMKNQEKRLLQDKATDKARQSTASVSTSTIPISSETSMDNPLGKMFGLLFYLKEHDTPESQTREMYEKKLQEILGDEYEARKELFEKDSEPLIFMIEKTFKDKETLEKDAPFLYTIFEQDFYKAQLHKLRDEIAGDELLGLDTSEKLQEVARITQKMHNK